MVKNIQKEVDYLLEQEDIKWKQGAKLVPFRGQEYKIFSHVCYLEEEKLDYTGEDSMSVLRMNQQEIQKAFEDYYRDVYCSTHPSQEAIDRGLDHVQC